MSLYIVEQCIFYRENVNEVLLIQKELPDHPNPPTASVISDAEILTAQ